MTSFDTVFYAFIIIFQCVTLEGWSGIMVMLQKCQSVIVILYFIPIIFVGAFFLLNLTLAVIKSKFTEEHKKKQGSKSGKKKKKKKKKDDFSDDEEEAKRKEEEEKKA